MNKENIDQINRLNNVLDYIDKNLKDVISLDDLAQIAHLSKFHFLRVFKRHIQLRPIEYITHKRLERAASILEKDGNKNIAQIGYDVGFTDPSIFSRNFKKYYHCSPMDFRLKSSQKSKISQVKSNEGQAVSKPLPYFCVKSKSMKWMSNLEHVKEIEVKRMKGFPVAYVRSIGKYEGNNAKYQQDRNELLSWSAMNGLMNNPSFRYLILYHDNPNVALSDYQKMSICVTTFSDIKVEGKIGKTYVEEGIYAIFRCELRRSDFPTVWKWIFDDWMIHSNYNPEEKPYFEMYPEQPNGELFKVDFYIPVQSEIEG